MLRTFRDTNTVWDLATKKFVEKIRTSQGDSNGRKLTVQVMDGGEVVNLNGASLSLAWKTENGEQYGLDGFTAIDITKGIFELYYTTGMLSNTGLLRASLVLVDDVGRVESHPFIIDNDKSIINDDAIQSENSFTTLTQALIDISNLEQKYAPRLNDLTAQLQQTEQELSSQLAETIAMQTGLLVFKGSDTTANITAKTGMVTGDYWYSTDGLTYLAYTGTAWSNVGSSLTELSNVRLGADGVTYATAGDAVRGQIGGLDSALRDNNIVNLQTLSEKYNTAVGVTNTSVANTVFSITQDAGKNQYAIDVSDAPGGIAAFTFADRTVAFAEPIVFAIDFARTALATFFVRLRFKDAGGTQLNGDDYFYWTGDELNGTFTVSSAAYPTAVSVDLVQVGTGVSTVCNYDFNDLNIYKLADYEIYTNGLKKQVTDLEVRTTDIETALGSFTDEYIAAQNKPTIIIDFDAAAIDNRLDLIKEYGLTANMNMNLSGGYSVAQQDIVDAYIKAGFSISLYGGYGTKPTDYVADIAGWTTYINDGISQLKACGIYLPVIYSCSGHQSGTALRAAAKNLGFKYVRAATETTASGTTSFTGGANPNGDIIWPLTLNNTRTTANIDSWLAVVGSGGCLMLMSHAVGDTGDISETNFRTLMAHVKALKDSGAVNVLNINQYYAVNNKMQHDFDNFTRLMSAILDR